MDYTNKELAEILLEAARLSRGSLSKGLAQGDEIVCDASADALAISGVGYALLAILEKLDYLATAYEGKSWEEGFEAGLGKTTRRSQVIATDGGTVSGVHQSIGG